jgi:hypothetical protein
MNQRGGEVMDTINSVRGNAYLMYAIQLMVAAIIVVVVYYVFLAIIGRDSLVASAKNKQAKSKVRTQLMDGFIESSLIARTRFNTINPYAEDFLNLQRSYNRNGGAQFSYSFWMFLGNTNRENVANKDIFLRGDNRKYAYEERLQDGGGDEGEVLTSGVDKVIKCPRLRFGKRFNDLILEFNTQDYVMHKVNLTSQENATDSTIRHNLLSLIPRQWVLITITFEDNIPINDFENGIVIRTFVNDIMYFTHKVSSTIRQNFGDLYLFPDGEVKGMRIAQFTYYNYALGYDQVQDMYKEGPPDYRANHGDEITGVPMRLSVYNKTDLYNI